MSNYENTITAMNGLIQRLSEQEAAWSLSPGRGALRSSLRAATRSMEKARHAVETARMIEGAE